MENQKPLSFSAEEIAKFKARQLDRENKSGLTSENLLVAEFGYLYGWQAIAAVFNDEIDADTLYWLVQAGRQIKAIDRYNDTEARFMAVYAAKTKKPVRTFDSITKKLKEEANNGR